MNVLCSGFSRTDFDSLLYLYSFNSMASPVYREVGVPGQNLPLNWACFFGSATCMQKE